VLGNEMTKPLGCACGICGTSKRSSSRPGYALGGFPCATAPMPRGRGARARHLCTENQRYEPTVQRLQSAVQCQSTFSPIPTDPTLPRGSRNDGVGRQYHYMANQRSSGDFSVPDLRSILEFLSKAAQSIWASIANLAQTIWTLLSESARLAVFSFKDTPMTAPEPSDFLYEPDRRAIRSYMLKLVTPSAVVLGLVSGIVGYLWTEMVRERAYGVAYTTAYGQAIASILKTASDAVTARDGAENALVEITRMRNMVAVEIQALASKNYRELAEKLVLVQGFKESLAGVAQDQVDILSGKVKQLTDFETKITNLLASIRSPTPYTTDCKRGPEGVPSCTAACKYPDERLVGGLCFVPGAGENSVGYVQNLGFASPTSWNCVLSDVSNRQPLGAVRAVAYCIKLPQ
jgi:hypothetical protein